MVKILLTPEEIVTHLKINGLETNRITTLMRGISDTRFYLHHDDKVTILNAINPDLIGYSLLNRYAKTADIFNLSRAIGICIGRIHRQMIGE